MTGFFLTNDELIFLRKLEVLKIKLKIYSTEVEPVYFFVHLNKFLNYWEDTAVDSDDRYDVIRPS